MVLGRKKNETKEIVKQLPKEVVEQLPSMDEDTYEEVVKESEMLSPEEAQAKISVLLTEPKNLELMSEITPEERRRLAALKTVADHFKDDLLQKFIYNYLSLSVSLGRRGRGEVVEVAKPTTTYKETIRRGLKDILLGRRP